MHEKMSEKMRGKLAGKHSPSWQGFWQAFEQGCLQWPAAKALQSTAGPSLSYAELLLQTTSLSEALLQQGLQAGDRVGLLYGHSLEFVLAQLACWRAGLIWVPLQAEPRQRLLSLLEQLQPQALLAPEAFLPELQQHLKNAKSNPRPGQASELKLLSISLLQTASQLPPRPACKPEADAPAYLIFSSGSTGQPKGVLLPQRGLVSMLRAQIQAIGLQPGWRSLWLLSPLFDASLSDLGTALLSGATLVIDPAPLSSLERLYSLLHDWQITYLDLPPALLAALEQERMPASLKSLLIGGEAPQPEVVRRWASRYRLLNVYGPTEATVCTSLERCGPDWQRPTLGQPLPGVRYQLGPLPAADNPSVDSQPQQGELWISSPGLALGYWQQSELTASRFREVDGQRWYASGDWVEHIPEGQWIFLGRCDRQFKHLGRLICPEEIEAALLSLPAVNRAYLLSHPQRGLLACLEGQDPQPDLQTLHTHLQAHLPKWMLPQAVVWLTASEWPLTASGKTAPQALLALLADKLSSTTAKDLSGGHTPLSATAQHLARIWQKVLPALGEPLQPDSEFLALGGSSIDVLRCVALAAEQGLFLVPEWFYQARSLEGIAELAASTQAPDQALEVAALRQRLTAQPPASATANRPHRPAKGILLTGATGFLGAGLLAQLLQHSTLPLHCLVRARDKVHAWQRLEAALAPWQPATGWQSRVTPWCADLSQPQLGMQAHAYQALLDSFAQVLHCAAQVDLVRDLGSLYGPNVQALQQLYALSAAHGRPLHYVSSLSVLVAAEPRPPAALESDRLTATRRVYGGYAQSKWLAEDWLLQQDCAKVWLYRPGLVTGHSQLPHLPQRDWLGWLLQGLASLGALPDIGVSQLAVDLTPVDYVAQGIVALMQAPAGIYHLANPQPLLLTELLTELQQAGGWPLLPVKDWLFNSQQQLQQTAEPQFSAALLALCQALASAAGKRWHSLNLFQATGMQLASPQTIAHLATVGITCEAPQQLLHRYLQQQGLLKYTAAL